MADHIDIVCDAPPGQDGPHGGRFVELEDEHHRSLKIGEWIKRDDGL